jgi:putative effector of murein hydrolase
MLAAPTIILATILTCQLAGEVVARGLGFALPGPVIGLALVRPTAVVGVAALGIGTARAFQVNETAGTFAGIGMCLNAILTTIIAPWFIALFR